MRVRCASHKRCGGDERDEIIRPATAGLRFPAARRVCPPPEGGYRSKPPLPRQNGCREIKTAPSLVTSDTSAFDSSAYNTHMIIDAVRVVCPPGSLCSGRESVRWSVPSTAATAAGGFAAERRRLSRCRPTAAGTVLQARRRSAATAGSVVLRDDGRGSAQNCGV